MFDDVYYGLAKVLVGVEGAEDVGHHQLFQFGEAVDVFDSVEGLEAYCILVVFRDQIELF